MTTRLKAELKLGPLKRLAKKSPTLFKKAKKIGAIQFLTWANNGSSNESRKPPIKWGVLRGSSSAFVGNELVEIFQQTVASGSAEKASPAISMGASSPKIITWVWNVNYAVRMHEASYSLGPKSAQDGDSGNKWVEKHLKADREDLIKVIGKEFKRLAGL